MKKIIIGYTHLPTTWWRISAIQLAICSFDEAFSSKVRLYNSVCGIDGIGIGPVYGMGRNGWHVDIDSSWSQKALIHDSSPPAYKKIGNNLKKKLIISYHFMWIYTCYCSTSVTFDRGTSNFSNRKNSWGKLRGLRSLQCHLSQFHASIFIL